MSNLHIEDLPGLNRTAIRDMPIIGSQALAEAVLSGAASRSLSIAGLRHSQGGHTVRRGGRMLLTETLRQVEYRHETGTVIADAGASWSQIHHVLRPHRRAPRVQQSSAHFSVGGSIAVNCHGRSAAEGPVGNTVERLWVPCGDGQLRECSRTRELQLFRAVIGGYGACGLIVRAELHPTEDIGLSEVWYRCT
ncbi:MAG: FAD-binding protein, partial [Anaerolineae bacterium]|nr:FAD-binding protein [Anaerolineae bacterium]